MNDREKPLEDRIRNAVASGEFAKANALWVELGDRLRCEMVAVQSRRRACGRCAN